jgi:hypothetical protein
MKICNCALPDIQGPEVCEGCSNKIDTLVPRAAAIRDYATTSTVIERIFRCCKCDQTAVNIKYVELDDNLLITCCTCGFDWCEETQDSIVKDEREKALKDFTNNT